MYTSVNLDIMQYICGFCGVEIYHVFFEQALGRHLSFLLGQFKPTKDDKWSVDDINFILKNLNVNKSPGPTRLTAAKTY